MSEMTVGARFDRSMSELRWDAFVTTRAQLPRVIREKRRKIGAVRIVAIKATTFLHRGVNTSLDLAFLSFVASETKRISVGH